MTALPISLRARLLVRSRARRTALMALALGLAGCASLPEPRPVEERPPEVWTGRFALTVEPSADYPEGRRESGNFELTAGQRFTELQLLSPLGNAIASARSDRNGAVLKTADGRSYQAASADELTEKLFGWRIPVDRLPQWLRGRVAEVVEAGPDPAQPLAGVEQGWQVRFEQWQALGTAGATEPQRLIITYPKRVLLRMVVSPRSSP